MVMPLRNDTTNIVTNNSTAKSPTARIGRLCLVNDTKKKQKGKIKKRLQSVSTKDVSTTHFERFDDKVFIRIIYLCNSSAFAIFVQSDVG